VKSINCIALEDEAPAIGLLQNYLGHFPEFCLTAHFVNAFEARSFLRKEQVDVIFLDIQLPGISGMDFLKLLENPPLVVITSAYDEHAIEAFGLEVFDYLLKPYSLARFTKTIDRIERRFARSEEKSTKIIKVQEGREIRKLDLEKVTYIESQREYMLFYLDDGGNIKTRMTMQEGEALFPSEHLIRIHRSFLVPKTKIKAVSRTEVILESTTLPIGRSYREKVRSLWG